MKQTNSSWGSHNDHLGSTSTWEVQHKKRARSTKIEIGVREWITIGSRSSLWKNFL